MKAAEGEGREEALVAFLRTLTGAEIERDFAEELAELKSLDPEDEFGFIAEMAAAKAMYEFEMSVDESLAAGEFDAVLKMVDDLIAKHNLQGEQKAGCSDGKSDGLCRAGRPRKGFCQN